MDKSKLEDLETVLYHLRLAVMNRFDSYEHIEDRNGVEKISEVNREEHLELILKYAIYELENIFGLEKK